MTLNGSLYNFGRVSIVANHVIRGFELSVPLSDLQGKRERVETELIINHIYIMKLP